MIFKKFFNVSFRWFGLHFRIPLQLPGPSSAVSRVIPLNTANGWDCYNDQILADFINYVIRSIRSPGINRNWRDKIMSLSKFLAKLQNGKKTS